MIQLNIEQEKTIYMHVSCVCRCSTEAEHSTVGAVRNSDSGGRSPAAAHFMVLFRSHEAVLPRQHGATTTAAKAGEMADDAPFVRAPLASLVCSHVMAPPSWALAPPSGAR